MTGLPLHDYAATPADHLAFLRATFTGFTALDGRVTAVETAAGPIVGTKAHPFLRALSSRGVGQRWESCVPQSGARAWHWSTKRSNSSRS